MIKIFKQIIFCSILLIGFLAWQDVSADTHTAISCENRAGQTDVQASINAAATGDIVIIPLGNCVWETTVDIPTGKKIILVGTLKSESNATNITASNTVKMLNMNESGSRVTDINFTRIGATSLSSAMINAKGVGWRIDHCNFVNTNSSSLAGDVAILADGTNVTVPPVGLIDNNTFTECRVLSTGMGTMAKQNAVWATPNTPGGSNTVYIEDNTFYRSTSASNVIDSNYGGSYVFRYNSVSGHASGYMAHSVQGNNRSTKWWELYGNINIPTGSPDWNAKYSMRGGTGVVLFNQTNVYNNGVKLLYNNYIGLDNVRDYTTAPTSLKCDSNNSSGWDGNIDGTGYPCRDQIGRGHDAVLWGDNPVSAYTQTLQPAYQIVNTDESGNLVPFQVYNQSQSINHIQADRDFYNYTTSFNGTSGVGCGTLASRPATCTTGVGFWATYQSCTDLAGMVGKNPATPISGILYKCTTTNNWTKYYTPYTYPHPLRNEVSLDITPPASPTGLAVS